MHKKNFAASHSALRDFHLHHVHVQLTVAIGGSNTGFTDIVLVNEIEHITGFAHTVSIGRGFKSITATIRG